ncbi:MAG: chitobiase/beta-hexosaminidase C-terminal domain-containing protein [Candidatus Obscuribacterales bacterium]|nr:chitobiase/beta-hexosaminidase C-terminal domain-containing protein [Candidatus Obscuribacterales bacterium]
MTVFRAKFYLLCIAFSMLWLGVSQAAEALNPPVISPGTGSYTSARAASIIAPSGTIFYTTDGSTPTSNSNQYQSPVIVNSPTQINAVAYQDGIYSTVATAYIDVNSALEPILQIAPLLRLTTDFGVVTGIGSPQPVQQWIDLSGNGYSATYSEGNEPILSNPSSSIGAISFNGTSQFLNLPTGFSNFASGMSIFLVVRPDTPSTDARFFELGNGPSNNNIYMSQPSSTGADLHVYNGSTDSSVTSSSAIAIGQFQLLEGIYNGTSTATVYTNGTQGAQNTSMQTAVNISRLQNYIGRASGLGGFYSGKIAEILIYPTQLTSTQRSAVESYYIQKYQTLSVVPVTPTISVAGGTLSGPTDVAVASQPGTITYITTDGSTPTTSSTVYSGPLSVYYSQTVKAISVRDGVQSSVASATYVLDSSQWPAPNPGDTTPPTINLQLPAPSI